MHFPFNMSGVEDSVENYPSCLFACCVVMVFESHEIFFVVLSFDLSHDFHAQYILSLTFFTAHASLAVENVR